MAYPKNLFSIRKLKVILPQAGSVYITIYWIVNRTIKITISSPIARVAITFVIILKVNTLSILAGVIPTTILNQLFAFGFGETFAFC